MAGVIRLLAPRLEDLPLPHLGAWLIAALVPVVVGAVVYFVAARALGLGEATSLLRRFR
jgi:hypothetical protein